MRKHFSEELEHLRERLVYMGGIVEEAITRSVRAVSERNPATAESVIGELEYEVNRLEVEIDEEALRLLALQQPLAVDLRFISAVLKINNDLERMADLAVNIAQSVPRLRESLPDAHVDLPLMSERVRWMTRTALDSLVSRNPELAHQVLVADDEVDRIRDEIFRALLRYITEHPQTVEPAMAQIFVARNLERIADHATNIAEDVIFWVEGVDVRHHLHDQHA